MPAATSRLKTSLILELITGSPLGVVRATLSAKSATVRAV